MTDVVLRDPSPDREAEEKESRLTLRLSPEAREALQWIADERRVSLGEAARRALGTERFLLEMVKKRHGKILVELPNERTKELVLI